ncbi:hypothetical protein [Pontiella sulfatireligans]|uniref:VanZ-like domain-containing protein n=1 Tax=Pontiella sulfatireligans TaxID=2750658 RepID=A0A6C2UI95_9BACT|nr:hypothetical protein [Pontiella sulfatireligans]VGO19848.1 hypothetical protein SCARR_01908 [Pontiella sulfatireligans]
MKKLLKLFFQTGSWTLAAVLIMHAVVRFTGYREQLDWLMHYSGGLAIAVFMYCTIALSKKWLGDLSKMGHLLFAFCAGCAVALFWDIGEFASDQILGTHVQDSLHETMMDLVYGALGVCTVIAIQGCRLLLSTPTAPSRRG